MPVHVYVGCYTSASPVGIHGFELGDDGTVRERTCVDTVEHASFLAVHPDTDTLYAVRETATSGALVAVRRSGRALTPIDQAPSHGAAPCHVSTDGSNVYVANYGSGTVAAYSLRPDGGFGELIGSDRHHGSGPHPRQDAPHAHCIVPAPDASSVFVTDLGTDRIVRYVLEPTERGNRLRHADETVLAPGSGPRHLTFHPTHPVAFASCELDCTLAVMDVDEATGRLHPRTTVSTLPADVDGGSIAAEVCVHPDGRRVYVSNRGHDSIATFCLDEPGADPELLGHVSSGGRTPRHFAIHPSGRLLLVANQDSDNVVAFELDDRAALPRRADILVEVSQPVCITFVEHDR
jgi:6-phosphogluconolactonase